MDNPVNILLAQHSIRDAILGTSSGSLDTRREDASSIVCNSKEFGRALLRLVLANEYVQSLYKQQGGSGILRCRLLHDVVRLAGSDGQDYSFSEEAQQSACRLTAAAFAVVFEQAHQVM